MFVIEKFQSYSASGTLFHTHPKLGVKLIENYYMNKTKSYVYAVLLFMLGQYKEMRITFFNIVSTNTCTQK